MLDGLWSNAGRAVHSLGAGKGADMRKRLVCLVLLSVTIAATALYDSGRALATKAEGYKSTLLALGRFGEIDVSQSLSKRPEGGRERASLAATATDEGIVRHVCAKQCLGAGRKHRLALAPWA